VDENLSPKQKLMQELRLSTLGELQYLLERYCGPHKVLLAEKKYGYQLAPQLQRLINDEIALREFDNFLVSDDSE
jgi:hypothetical protein